MTSAQEFKEYLIPGNRVWISVEDTDKAAETNRKSKQTAVQYGLEGDMVYQGYQVFGTSTFMIFDQIKDGGRRSEIRTIAINATRILYLGVLDAD